ncbi:MAG: MobF family relaxase, partial [Burkholderiales bacterium]
ITAYLKNEKENGNAKEGYYSKNAAPSMWLGKGAETLGLHGPVDDKVLHELLQGHLPDGTDLSERGGRAAQARLGTDLTLSAMKSFSILATHDPRLLDLWKQSVPIAASIAEREFATARRGKGGVNVEHTGNLVMAAYQHEDARTVDGVADMDLHTHLLALNMTQRSDGKMVRVDLDFGERMVLAKTVDFAQKAWLAREVQKLGYEIRLTKDGWEFEGITQAQIDLFSQRSSQIDAALKAQGINPETASDSQKEAACLATRGSKTALGQVDQAYEWRARVRESGLDLDTMVSDVQARGPVKTNRDPNFSLEAVRSGARHMGERESVFSCDMTRLEALKAGMGGATLDTIETALDNKIAGLIDVGGGKLTTRETLYREQEILAHVVAGHNQVSAILPTKEVQSLIENTEATQGYLLSEGQREAITLALTTKDIVVGIVGAWGAGKTTGAVRPIVAQAKASGFHVIAMTPTTRAKKELIAANPDELMTISAWLQTKPALRKDGTSIRDEKRLIVMDEAAMVSAQDMDRVIQKLDAEGGRLVMVGDPQQLRSVGAGKPFQQMIESGSIRYAKISQVQRQSDLRLKEMAQVWANGDARGAVAIAREYMSSVTVTEADWQAAKMTPATVKESAKGPNIPREVRQASLARETADAYLKLSAEERADTVMMTSTNKLRSMVNQHVRHGLKDRGDLGAQEVTLRALDKTDMTDEALARPESYEGRSDLIVRMPRGKGKARHIIDYQVVGVDKERVLLKGPDGEIKRWNPSAAKSPSVYIPRDIKLSPGDEINFRDSAGLRDAIDRIENGEDGKVVRLSPEGPVLQMEDGRKVTLRANQNHPLDYGYCRTVHKAQGMTKGGAIYALESVGQQAIAQLAGVACTREKARLHILTDDPEKVSKVMEKWAEHETAMQATKASHSVDLETVKELRLQAQKDLGQAGDLSKARDAEQNGDEIDRLEREGQAERTREQQRQSEQDQEIER